jgi:hypothetical protein
MADPAVQQSQTFMLWVFAVLFIAMQVWLVREAVLVLSGPVGTDPNDLAIKKSVILVPVLWMCCGPVLLFRKPGGGRSEWRMIQVIARCSWVFGCTLCLLHIAIAFHLGHGWSHEAAWEHTRRLGGYGDGIYVNYAFALVWLVDAIWLCVACESYFARARWLSWTIHGFLAFVVINAAVVFGSWQSRELFATGALVLTGLVAAVRFKTPRKCASTHNLTHE